MTTMYPDRVVRHSKMNLLWLEKCSVSGCIRRPCEVQECMNGYCTDTCKGHLDNPCRGCGKSAGQYAVACCSDCAKDRIKERTKWRFPTRRRDDEPNNTDICRIPGCGRVAYGVMNRFYGRSPGYCLDHSHYNRCAKCGLHAYAYAVGCCPDCMPVNHLAGRVNGDDLQV